VPALTSNDIVAAARKAMNDGKLDKQTFREIRFGARLPFARRLIQRKFGDADGQIDWENIDWEELLAFITALIEIIMELIGSFT
jgi:hypothetical protein